MKIQPMTLILSYAQFVRHQRPTYVWNLLDRTEGISNVPRVCCTPVIYHRSLLIYNPLLLNG